LLQRHAIVGIDLEQLRGDSGEPQPLLYYLRGDEEDGRDILLGLPLLAQGLEGTELVEGMKSATRCTFSASESSSAEISVPVSQTMQGTGAVLASRFCFTSNSSAR
jgi:hypothetical protein